jgi:hypothetical protein
MELMDVPIDVAVFRLLRLLNRLISDEFSAWIFGVGIKKKFENCMLSCAVRELTTEKNFAGKQKSTRNVCLRGGGEENTIEQAT